MPIERVNILGVGVSAINMSLALEVINGWIACKEQHYVCITGVHGVIESQNDSALRGIHNQAGLVTPDGMPLVWLSHLQGQKQVTRVYGPDLLLALCRQSEEEGYRHYFFGGAEGVPELLAKRLQELFPELKVAGSFSPPFRPVTDEEDADIVNRINAANPDIVWIGLSTPKQERWMAAHLGRLDVPVMIGVGAAFDFHAGLKAQAPLWMQRNGLEWLFRLFSEPRRLGRRYLVNNPRFIVLILAQILKLRRYALEI